jgi:glucokinase
VTQRLDSRTLGEDAPVDGGRLALAVDIGGTRIKMGLVSAAGDVAARAEAGVELGMAFEQQLSTVADVARSLVDELGLAFTDLRGVAIGVQSVVDFRRRRILSESSQKNRGASSWAAAEWSREVFGLPIVLENDARMALVGEWRYGAGLGVDNLVVVTVGTGVGTAALVDGRLLRGATGVASILGGHTSVPGPASACYCGRAGCAEAEASSGFLERLISDVPGCLESDLAALDKPDYRDVVAAANSGSTCATEVLARSIRTWTECVINLVLAYDPERIVFGGGLITHVPDIRRELTASVVKALGHVEWLMHHNPDITHATRGDDAALLAAHPLLDEFQATIGAIE